MNGNGRARGPGAPGVRIALVSATAAAVGPAVAGLGAAFPEARPWNLLDDALLTDADAAGGLTPALADRMRRLIAYAVEGGARGVLLTCSLYGPVAARAGVEVPVLAADAAAFAAALGGGHREVLVLATFAAALDDSLDRLRAAARAARSPTRIVGRVIAPGTVPDPGAADAVLLAQYSLAPHADALAEALGLPVHAGPHAAARALRAAVKNAAVKNSAAPSAAAPSTAAAPSGAEGPEESPVEAGERPLEGDTPCSE
ncbi:hypothetical protein C9F11_03245 [Streptomyces sp. YIM 121038]|uniref:hypothetical protein n=1 Tax=Streptomyces sp. YIM 121038 TaxID=2136401 RepID=UPI0011640436|nr:hypothetical protein [Streptomyces sp. YIM 121038]QCX74352.1 hypothetical protein C9F11_03245 [Streptomyces sp. YIM 121038]